MLSRWFSRKPPKALSPYGRAFKLTNRKRVSADTHIYRFGLQTDEHVLGLPIGQHVLLAPLGTALPSRPYTPITIDQVTKGYVEFLIKTYPTGRLTPWLSRLEIGDEAFVSGPFGPFTYEGRGAVKIHDEITGERRQSVAKSLTMFAGGTGITPLYQLVQAIQADPDDKTTIDFNRSAEDVLLLGELTERLKAWGDSFRATFYVDTVTRLPSAVCRVEVSQGPVPEGMVGGQLTPEAVEKIISEKPPTDMVLGCGPPGMIENCVLPAMEATGATKEQRTFIF